MLGYSEGRPVPQCVCTAVSGRLRLRLGRVWSLLWHESARFLPTSLHSWDAFHRPPLDHLTAACEVNELST